MNDKLQQTSQIRHTLLHTYKIINFFITFSLLKSTTRGRNNVLKNVYIYSEEDGEGGRGEISRPQNLKKIVTHARIRNDEMENENIFLFEQFFDISSTLLMNTNF